MGWPRALPARHEARSCFCACDVGALPRGARVLSCARSVSGRLLTMEKSARFLRSTTQGGEDVFGVPTHPNSLAIGGRVWPLDLSISADGATGEWTEGGFVLTDHGWTGLVSDLLGPWRDREGDPCDVGRGPGERTEAPGSVCTCLARGPCPGWPTGARGANPSKTISLPERSREQMNEQFSR